MACVKHVSGSCTYAYRTDYTSADNKTLNSATTAFQKKSERDATQAVAGIFPIWDGCVLLAVWQEFASGPSGFRNYRIRDM